MFDELSARFEDAVKGLRGEKAINEENVELALKEVRRALLEADVSLSVVKDFVEEVRQKAIGAEVVRGVKPGEKFIQVVHNELVEVMGGNNSPLTESTKKPSVILMAGLQGAGKTTATAKLGLHLKEKGKKTLLVAADVYRPAAIDQLSTLGKQIDVEVFSLGKDLKPEEIASAGLAKAQKEDFDNLIVDTAGRLQIDKEMMDEMVRINSAVNPDEVLLVVDSMIGQEAADITRAFHEKIGITGAVLTKLDGDSRGGAALSIKKISGQPIKFIGTGEKVEALQPFHPERMAGRILGMGDVLTLVEKAQKEVEIADAEQMQRKFQEATFDFSDFVKQMRLIKRMGSLGGLMKMIPGMNKIDDGMLKSGEEQLKRIEAMIGSMTDAERLQPELLAAEPSRRRRVALGSGHTPPEMDKVLADFQKMRGLMKQMSSGAGMPGLGGFPGLGGPGSMPGSAPNQFNSRKSGGSIGSKKRQRPHKKKKGFGDL
ncbi:MULTISPECIES: signal recognition particle protein [unclassified Prochlorococcus]|uniref:signal recognition particle protein n=1 Tax=unclassified Prochlorococcus TaxID=2627481 RepID=UPI000533B1C2|nr:MULTISPECIES: signal recognition particle protein [unclassified Prochlorococcus]KGG16282.1 Signal recognition particle [Prochlorococcus sp. MIT 0603]KGG17984.1 Signal recognition particle [Prochlorococcus sp. MIT 0602]